MKIWHTRSTSQITSNSQRCDFITLTPYVPPVLICLNRSIRASRNMTRLFVRAFGPPQATLSVAWGLSCVLVTPLFERTVWETCRREKGLSRWCHTMSSRILILVNHSRYCNLDFIILSAILGVALACIFITYDIACQWSKYFKRRMLEFPEHMQISDSTQIKTAIPSWHIHGHGPACRTKFNLGYTKGVGRTCGEEVEITWSHTNPLAPSVREMAMAARRDTLNDHWNGWNFRKRVGFGKPLVLESMAVTHSHTQDLYLLENSKRRHKCKQSTRAFMNSLLQPLKNP